MPVVLVTAYAEISLAVNGLKSGASDFVTKPWDNTMFRVIEKAIIDSDLGITPDNNGEIIRLGIPPLTEERRKELTKQVKKYAEESKVAMRNIRRDGMDYVKKLKKNSEITEDDLKDCEEQVQKIHDKFIKNIDELVAAKEKEILSI